MTARHHYRAHGLMFNSEIELPEFTPSDPGPSDVTLRIGDEARVERQALSDPEPARRNFVETPAGAVLWLKDEADILVRDGSEIVVSLEPECLISFLRLHLIGSTTGMVLHQRGHLILHGAAIEQQAGVTVFVGHSGAGKSTLAANFGHIGHNVLSDDTLALHETPNGFQAWPGSRVFKVWKDALENMGRTPDGLNHVVQRYDKFFLPNTAAAPDQPQPIAEVIVLERSEDASPPSIKPVQGLEALQRVAENAYRPEYAALLGRQAPHFKQTAALIGSVPTYVLRRPWDLNRMPEVMDLLQVHWGTAPGLEGASA